MRTRHKTNYPGIYYRLEDESKPKGPRRYIVWYAARKAIELLTIPNRRPDIAGAIDVLWDGMGEQPSATPDTPPELALVCKTCGAVEDDTPAGSECPNCGEAAPDTPPDA